MHIRPRLTPTTLAILVLGGLLAGIAVHAYLYPWSHTVYNIYGPAARHWWAGEDMYAPVVKEWWEGPDTRVTTTDYYRYSPVFAVAVTPFALLPDSLGNPLWKLCNAAILGAGLWCAARRLFPITLDRGGIAALFLLVVPVSLTSLYIGQANLVVVGAMLLGLTAAASERWNAAAGWLAAATLIKGYPFALALLLMALYPRRFPLRFAAALAVGLLLPFAAQTPDVVQAQYASWLAHLSDSTILMRERLRSVDHLFAIAQYPLSPQAFTLLEMASGAVVLGLCALHFWRPASPRERLTWVLTLFSTWVVLFGPATEACTYVMIGPALAWSLLDTFRRPAGWGVRIFLIACLILMGPLVTDFFGATVRILAHRYGSQPVGGLLYLGYLAAETVRSAWQPLQMGAAPMRDRLGQGLDGAHPCRGRIGYSRSLVIK